MDSCCYSSIILFIMASIWVLLPIYLDSMAVVPAVVVFEVNASMEWEAKRRSSLYLRVMALI